MTATPNPWTDERKALAVHLWEVEGLSAGEIARRLGDTTRCAVLGKLKRLGRLGGRQPQASDAAALALRNERKRQANRRNLRCRKLKAPSWCFTSGPLRPPARPRKAPATPEPPSLGIDLLDIQNGQCRWPHGDPKLSDFGFCGHPADGSYCDHHHGRAYQP